MGSQRPPQDATTVSVGARAHAAPTERFSAMSEREGRSVREVGRPGPIAVTNAIGLGDASRRRWRIADRNQRGVRLRREGRRAPQAAVPHAGARPVLRVLARAARIVALGLVRLLAVMVLVVPRGRVDAGHRENVVMRARIDRPCVPCAGAQKGDQRDQGKQGAGRTFSDHHTTMVGLEGPTALLKIFSGAAQHQMRRPVAHPAVPPRLSGRRWPAEAPASAGHLVRTTVPP